MKKSAGSSFYSYLLCVKEKMVDDSRDQGHVAMEDKDEANRIGGE